MSSRGHVGILARVLASVARSVSRRPAGVMWLVALLCALCLGTSVRFLSFKTDRADLIDSREAFQQRWLRYTSLFGNESDAVVVVEADDPEVIREVLDTLGGRLAEEPQLFDRISYKFDPAALRRKGLQYLPPEALQYVAGLLERHADVLNGHWDRAGLQAATERLYSDLRSGDPRMRALALHGSELLTASLRQFLTTGEFTSPWLPCFPAEAAGLGASFAPVYQLSESGRMGFLLTVPAQGQTDFGGTSRSLDRLRQLIADVAQEFPTTRIGLTGIPVLESDEMRRSQSDMSRASLISLVGVGTALVIGFRGIRHTVLAIIMLLVGVAWSLGFATLAVGHLNILSVSFATILIGLGIDFAIHYLSRYLELRHHGAELRPALMKASASVGPGIVTGAVTTALAFFCSMFTSFLGVAELGIIAAGGILLCCVSTFVVLPSLIAVADRSVEPRRLPTPFQGKWLRRLVATSPGVVASVSVAVLLVLGGCALTLEDGRLAPRVRYDANLLNLQARDVESVHVLERVYQEAQGSLLYAVALAGSPAEAVELRQRFLDLPSVARVDELASHLPAHPPRTNGPLLQHIAGLLRPFQQTAALPRDLPQLNPQSIGQALEDLFLRLRAIDDPKAALAVQALNDVLDRLEVFELDEQVALLDQFQYAMLTALRMQFEALAAIADPAPVSVQDFPRSVRERFVSADGTWLLRIYPREHVWDEAPLARFVADVRSVDPEVTGTPLQNYEAARQIRESYLQAALYAFICIWLVLMIDNVDPAPLMIGLLAPLIVIGFTVVAIPVPDRALDPTEILLLYTALVTASAAIFDFKNVRNTALMLVPPVGGAVMMFGVMGLCEMDLNPANMIVLPLILGIGVDSGVHVVHGFRSQRQRYRIAPSMVNALVLTSLTTMIGFGSMIVGSHRGLAGLGLVLVIGMGCCLVVSLVTLPAILTLISRRDPRRRDAVAAADHDPDDESTSPPIVRFPVDASAA